MEYRISIEFLDSLNIRQLQIIATNIGLADLFKFEEEERDFIICAIYGMLGKRVEVERVRFSLYVATYRNRVGFGCTADLAIFDAIFLSQN